MVILDAFRLCIRWFHRRQGFSLNILNRRFLRFLDQLWDYREDMNYFVYSVLGPANPLGMFWTPIFKVP